MVAHHGMIEDYTKMRRNDRAVTDDSWIKRFLAESSHGVLATECEGQPFVHINTFVYDEATQAIYLHTAKEGRFRSTIEVNERVSFCASRMGRLLPAKTAREMSVEFESVIAFGRASIVIDLDLGLDKMQLLLDKYFSRLRPGKEYRAITPEEITEISVIKIAIDGWSAKRKQERDDFPGAFQFGESGGGNG